MKLSPPHSGLRVSVVVPARNEEALVGDCLRALVEQQSVRPEQYEVLLVLDRCTDETEQVAREVAGSHPRLRLHFLEGTGEGSGHARRLGMETACQRLLGVGRPCGLVASTDADTTVAPDWLAAQLEAAKRGARAIGGRITLSEDGSLPKNATLRHTQLGHARHLKLLSELGNCGTTEHWQFSGASLALTAATYRRVGGLKPLTSLEDEHLEHTLRRCGIPIERLLSVRAETSSRTVGRARDGLANDLAQIVSQLSSKNKQETEA